MLTWTLKMPTTPLPPLLVFHTCTFADNLRDQSVSAKNCMLARHGILWAQWS